MRIKKAEPKKRKRDVEKRILSILARKGISWSYDIWEKEKVATRKAVEKALKRLKNERLIEVAGFEKRGTIKTLYKLTMFGLFVAFFSEETWEHIDKVAERQEDKLPLIFGKWNYFEEKGVKERVVESMRSHLFSPTSEIIIPYPPPSTYLRIEPLMEDYESRIREDLTRQVLFPTSISHPDYDRHVVGWAKVLIEDEDLKHYTKEELNHREEKYLKALNIVKLWKDYIKTLEGSRE